MKIHILIFFLCIGISYVLNAQKEIIISSNPDTVNCSDKIYVLVDRSPVFPGGADSLMYFFSVQSDFEICSKDANCSSIYFSIVIDTLGNAKRFRIIKGLNKAYNADAKRIVSLMPLWEPGLKNDKVVNTLVTLEINYKKE